MGVRRGDGADHSADGISFRCNQLSAGDMEDANAVLKVVADYKLKCLSCGTPLEEGSQGELCAKCAAAKDDTTD